MSLVGMGELLDAVAKRRYQDMMNIRNGKQVTIMGAVNMRNCERCKISCEHVSGICTGCNLPWRPPVPRGLSSGVKPAPFRIASPDEIIELMRQADERAALISEKLIDRSRRYSRESAATKPQVVHPAWFDGRARPTDLTITGLPDCRGNTCDGMCGNPDCVGDRALRRAANRLQPRWRIAVYVAGVSVVGVWAVAMQLHPAVTGALSFATSSVLFAWAFWKSER
jgi:hypothetical protein